MYVQLNCVIIDADPTNRQELAQFLTTYGINVLGQLPAPRDSHRSSGGRTRRSW
jgi:hypothetical protein